MHLLNLRICPFASVIRRAVTQFYGARRRDLEFQTRDKTFFYLNLSRWFVVSLRRFIRFTLSNVLSREPALSRGVCHTTPSSYRAPEGSCSSYIILAGSNHLLSLSPYGRRWTSEVAGRANDRLPHTRRFPWFHRRFTGNSMSSFSGIVSASRTSV